MTETERRRVIPLATRAAIASVTMALFLLGLKGFAAWWYDRLTVDVEETLS